MAEGGTDFDASGRTVLQHAAQIENKSDLINLFTTILTLEYKNVDAFRQINSNQEMHTEVKVDIKVQISETEREIDT